MHVFEAEFLDSSTGNKVEDNKDDIDAVPVIGANLYVDPLENIFYLPNMEAELIFNREFTKKCKVGNHKGGFQFILNWW